MSVTDKYNPYWICHMRIVVFYYDKYMQMRCSMSSCKFPNLFSPITINGITFKNRVFASPITTNRIVLNGAMTPEGIDAYETKSRGGFSVVTVTESFIDDEFSRRHEHGLNIYSKNMSTYHMESIMTLTEAILAHGAVPSIQLNHVGAMNHPKEIKNGLNPIGPCAHIREDGVQVDEMSPEMMQTVATLWAEAALNCKNLGFKMINLHGGHGWLLNQFISPRFNQRTDEYGGSMANRAKFPIMVCKKIKELCGENFIIEYRLSGSERIEGGMTLEDGIAFAQIIQDYVDIIHVTSGLYQDHVNSKAFSSMFDEHGCNLDLAEAIKAHVKIPVVSVGGFNSPEQIEAALASGKCDFVALGRQQFADPEFVNKALLGMEDQIAPCLRCSCFNPLRPNPEERPTPSLWHCAVNPLSNRELRWRQAPTPLSSRKVVVIGGGVAGMFAAITAARRGHEVTLYEKNKTLGGQLSFTEIDTHKESLKRFKDALVSRCHYHGVEIKLNEAVSPQTLKEKSPDAVICAVGALAYTPSIKGIEKASYAVEAYSHENLEGKNVVMIGGGAIGCETGYYLAHVQKVNLTILEARPKLAMGSNDSQRIALLPRLEKEKVKSVTCATVTEILENRVCYKDAEGKDQFVLADAIYYACGSKSNMEMVEQLKGVVANFIVIGDAKAARTVKEATYEGFCAAMAIL